jgi:hypothetical protein
MVQVVTDPSSRKRLEKVSVMVIDERTVIQIKQSFVGVGFNIEETGKTCQALTFIYEYATRKEAVPEFIWWARGCNSDDATRRDAEVSILLQRCQESRSPSCATRKKTIMQEAIHHSPSKAHFSEHLDGATCKSVSKIRRRHAHSQ